MSDIDDFMDMIRQAEAKSFQFKDSAYKDYTIDFAKKLVEVRKFSDEILVDKCIYICEDIPRELDNIVKLYLASGHIDNRNRLLLQNYYIAHKLEVNLAE
jgi:hypothetical protein